MKDKFVSYIKRKSLKIAVCGVLIFWLLNALLCFFFDKSGIFGDQFGAINALFSGFAFIGLIYTILQQHKSLELQRKDLENQFEELKLNRKELELTRKEMEEQTDVFVKQSETQKIQRFENTFFNMLELQQQIVNGLNYTIYDKQTVRENEDTPANMFGKKTREVPMTIEIKGRDLFYYAFSGINHSFTSFGHISKEQGLSQNMYASGFKAYIDSNLPTFFDHYFRHLYTILKFIKGNNDILSDDD